MPLRLEGLALQALRVLTSVPPVRAAVWTAAAGDFRIPELGRLPASCRLPLDDIPAPLAGRAPHAWADAGLGVPTPRRTTCTALTERYATGALSPVEVVARVLEAHEAGPYGRAARSPFIAVAAEEARAAALASASRWAAGRALGPLDGVPVPVKDELDVAGLPSRGGTRYREAPRAVDAWAVARLRAVGAIVVGKTHATEWGLNPWGANAHRELPRNVWDADRGAGGSSTGSGVAVALGWAPCAVGSDGGGSIRIPSALNGVIGLKPSFLRVGRTGDDWGVGSTVAHLGPIAGSTADAVALLVALSGVDPNDAATTFAPDGHDVAAPWAAAIGRGVRGARIGVLRSAWADADPAVAREAEAALDALVAEGAVRVDLELPEEPLVGAIGSLLIASESAANLADDLAAHGPDFGDELAFILQIMRSVGAQELLAAARVRAWLRRKVAGWFAHDIDLLAFPTTATVAPAHPRDVRHDVFDAGATAAMTRFAFLANLLGLPAGTVPCGRVGGLPVGLQLVGDAWDEASVIAGLAHGERQGWSDVGLPEGYLELAP